MAPVDSFRVMQRLQERLSAEIMQRAIAEIHSETLNEELQKGAALVMSYAENPTEDQLLELVSWAKAQANGRS